MIVVDSVVLADFLAGAPALRAAAVRLADLDPEWISCGLWRYEVGNVLYKQVRWGGLDPKVAARQMELATSLLTIVAEEVDAPGVLALALKEQLTYYDASYVWLARSRRLSLYTRDEQILRACADSARPMPV